MEHVREFFEILESHTSIISVIISGIFGFLGFVIAGLSLFLSYKERKAAFRNELYKKQVEVYEKLTDYLKNYDNTFKTFLLNFKDSPEALNMYNNIYNLFRELEKQIYKWSIFFPNDVNSNIFKYIRTCHKIYNSILDYYESSKSYDSSKNDIKNLSDNYALVLDSIRKAVGTEPLSEEILKMFGEIPKQIKGRTAQK